MMHSNKLPFVLMALALGACSPDAAGSDAAETKQAARDRMQSASSDTAGNGASGAPASIAPARPGPADVCLAQRWYGDGECDAWCPEGDAADCRPSSGGGVACAEFFSPADGYCDPNDPCGPVQDEDCQKGGGSQPCAPHPTPGPTLPDGKCDPKSAEELKLDPDCADLACPAIFSPADGQCEPKGPCDFVIDEDCAKSGGGNSGSTPCDGAPDGCVGPGNPGGGVICLDILYPDNGKCEAAPGCEGSDPHDCALACDAIAYPENGKCEAPPGCEANDPEDCAVICPAILYPKNGKCEAGRGCERSDPDC